MTLWLLTLAVLVWAAWLLGQPWWQRWRHQRIRQQPFPAEWRRILRRRVPISRRLPVDLQLQLKKRMQVFLAEKAFIGCDGLQVTDEMRVTVAAQACLLLLNRGDEVYPQLRQVLLYPAAFIVEQARTGPAGEVQVQRRVLLGESWSQGQVILSWPDVLDGAAQADDGRNVVIHEFAHQLDQQSGPANGAPWLPGRARHERWSAVLGAAYEQLRAHDDAGEPDPLFDRYGATDPAEFFAVVSEVFFERPRRMADEHPALYQELAGFYRVDPAGW